MSEHYILNESGEPEACDLMTWAKWFNDDDKRRVAMDRIGDVKVSTVFLGLDHRFDSNGPPLIFETMVFGGPLSDEMDRYSTRAEALIGHAAMIERVKAGK